MSVSESATDRPGLLVGLYRRFQHLIHEVAKFGVVGAVGFIVDWGVFNLCGIVFGLGPLTSKTASTTVSATLAFAGNRFWTWRHRPRTNLGREYFLFVVMNAVGLLISLLFLGFSHYVLGDVWPSIFQTNLADNISGQFIGTGVATLFRFWSYRRWVFLPPGDPPVDPATGLPEPEEGPAKIEP